MKVEIDSHCEVDEIHPVQTNPIKDPEGAILSALENPLSKQTLQDFIHAKSMGIAINDKTRPVPKPDPLPLLLDHLDRLGFSKNTITLYIGSGTHTPMSEDDYGLILPKSIIENYRIISHDCDNSRMVNLGKTSFGTPIEINQDFYNCELKITLGNIEPHHFMGFSGGVKTAAIGLASRKSITANHAMLIDAQARSGTYRRNPLRRDIEEIGQKVNIHFTLGSILEEDKNILGVFFGDPQAVMEAAIPKIRNIFGVTVPKAYDLVVASPGGYPKDINLYQAEKGLTHASRITRDGGSIILVAACPEGSGSPSFEDYISSMETLDAIIEDFKGGFFKIGPHKAFQIAREAQRVNITLISGLPTNIVEKWKLTPGNPEEINQMISQFTENQSKNARIAIMPAATRTITELINES